MTGHDQVDTGSLRVDIDISRVVHHVYGLAAKLDHLDLGQTIGPWTFVVVSPHRVNAGNCSQTFDDFRRTHVSRMQDDFAPSQVGQSCRSQQRVRIRNDPDYASVRGPHDKTPDRIAAMSTLTPPGPAKSSRSRHINFCDICHTFDGGLNVFGIREVTG